MANAVLNDSQMANDASDLAAEVAIVLRRHAIVSTTIGTVWAYEVDGLGGRVLMDDANAPSLLSLPYLDSSPDAALYARTRRFVWSPHNPWFCQGSAGEGIGGPHIGRDSIWPMSQILYALTSQSAGEISHAIRMLRASAASTGFIHESYKRNDSANFTRASFAWANTLFGELIARTAQQQPNLLG
jgi:meiotically up-regulated gene 157 (Mug157) protein